METFDFSLYIVTYNLIIGILLIIASEKLGVYAGFFMGSYREKVSRLTSIAVMSFGICIAVISIFVLVAGHLLRL